MDSATLNMHKVGLRINVAYGLPVVAISFMVAPAWSVLQGLYVVHFGLSLSAVATVFLLARLFDAVTDPIVGRWSDRVRAHGGHRKIFVLFGGVALIVSSYFLYVPPPDVTQGYFLAWFFAFALSWTLFEIPHLAWGGELTPHSQQRTSIYGMRTLFFYLGVLAFFSVPQLPFFDTREITPETLRWSVMIAGALTLPLLIICVRSVPTGYTTAPDRGTRSSAGRTDATSVIKAIIGNRPLLIFLGAYLLSGTGLGMWTGLLYIVVDSYLGLGETLSTGFLLGLSAGIVGLACWVRIAAKLGKTVTWSLGVATTTAAMLGASLWRPGEASAIQIVGVMMMGYFGYAASTLLAPSLLADISDYGTLRFGRSSGATYFAAYMFISKTNVGLGAALGLAIAARFGFDPEAAAHSDTTAFGLRLAFAYLPAVLTLLSLIFVAMTPINARRHAIIARRLDARARHGESAAGASDGSARHEARAAL